MRWVDGRFIYKSLNPGHLYKIGIMLAGFHNVTPDSFGAHRHYWDAQGLAGANPKFGSYDRLEGVNAADQQIITASRLSILERLSEH